MKIKNSFIIVIEKANFENRVTVIFYGLNTIKNAQGEVIG